jgi:hypothetical protein
MVYYLMILLLYLETMERIKKLFGERYGGGEG